MRKDMKRKNDRLVALLGAVLCACACLVGCERKEAASPEPPASAVSNAPAKQADSRLDDESVVLYVMATATRHWERQGTEFPPELRSKAWFC